MIEANGGSGFEEGGGIEQETGNSCVKVSRTRSSLLESRLPGQREDNTMKQNKRANNFGLWAQRERGFR